MAEKNSAEFYIYLNGKQISDKYIVYNSNNASLMYHTGTVVLVLQLLPNNSVRVHNPGFTMHIGVYSTLTIVKVK